MVSVCVMRVIKGCRKWRAVDPVRLALLRTALGRHIFRTSVASKSVAAWQHQPADDGGVILFNVRSFVIISQKNTAVQHSL